MSEELKSLKIKFQEYLNLNYIKSRYDPEDEPFKTKYEARKILKTELDNKFNLNLPNSIELIGEKDDLTEEEIEELTKTYKLFINKLNFACELKYSMSGKSFLIQKLFEFNLAKNYIETEEFETGERLISKIILELENLENTTEIYPVKEDSELYNPIIFNLKLSCFLESVFIWSHRSEYEKCSKILKVIDEIYSIYQGNLKNISENKKITNVPFDPIEIFGINKEISISARRASFEALYTHSMFYSAQVYGKMDIKEKSAYYCQMTLQRQIDEHNEKTTPNNDNNTTDETIQTIFNQQPQEKVNFNPLDWATHAGALSQFYVTEGDFATARHCLCCADAILNKLNETDNSEKLREQTHSIKRCWGKYGIEILKTAKSKLYESTEHEDNKILLSELDKPSKFHFNLPKNEYNIDKIEKTAISSNIPLDYDQAKKIFLSAQTILVEARNFFVLDGYVTDHFEITRDLSELYQKLIFFESDLERRCKMHKRRLDLLTPVCDEINEQFYLSVKRQLLFDIGSVYSDMMDCKFEIFSEKKEKNLLSQKESVSSVTKINQLAINGIKRFEEFLHTMKVQPKREFLPDKYDDHNLRPALLAKFYIGRFYSKIITNEPAKKLMNMKHTKDNYTYLVEYCEKNEKNHPKEIIDSMQVEYNVCKEMIAFLPAKMDKIRSLI